MRLVCTALTVIALGSLIGCGTAGSSRRAASTMNAAVFHSPATGANPVRVGDDVHSVRETPLRLDSGYGPTVGLAYPGATFIVVSVQGDWLEVAVSERTRLNAQASGDSRLRVFLPSDAIASGVGQPKVIAEAGRRVFGYQRYLHALAGDRDAYLLTGCGPFWVTDEVCVGSGTTIQRIAEAGSGYVLFGYTKDPVGGAHGRDGCRPVGLEYPELEPSYPDGYQPTDPEGVQPILQLFRQGRSFYVLDSGCRRVTVEGDHLVGDPTLGGHTRTGAKELERATYSFGIGERGIFAEYQGQCWRNSEWRTCVSLRCGEEEYEILRITKDAFWTSWPQVHRPVAFDPELASAWFVDGAACLKAIEARGGSSGVVTDERATYVGTLPRGGGCS
jgi:hypothetical protein